MNFRLIVMQSVSYRINAAALVWCNALDDSERNRTGRRAHVCIRHRMQLHIANGVGAFIEARNRALRRNSRDAKQNTTDNDAGRSLAAAWRARTRVTRGPVGRAAHDARARSPQPAATATAPGPLSEQAAAPAAGSAAPAAGSTSGQTAPAASSDATPAQAPAATATRSDRWVAAARRRPRRAQRAHRPSCAG